MNPRSVDAFPRAVEVVLAHEGGYSNDLQDPGGETKFGISKRSYPDLDISTLTKEDAVALYRRDFWERLKLGLLPAALGMAVFDGAVNQGPRPAVRMLQQCLGVKRDGIVGDITAEAARHRDTEEILEDFLAERALRYAATASFDRFGQGWVRRLFRLHTVCLRATSVLAP